MKNYYLIADTHFNHVDKMIKYCNRPKNYEYRLYKSLNRIDKEDILIHLGDVAFGDVEQAHKKYIKPLKCKKILVKGNHDHETNSRYYKLGWDFVCYTFADTFYGHRVLFSHYPKEIKNYDFNIFAHMHNNVKTIEDITPENRKIITDKHLLISVEYSKYQPVSLNHVLDKPDKFKLLNMIESEFSLNLADIEKSVYYTIEGMYIYELRHLPTGISIHKEYGEYRHDKNSLYFNRYLIKELTQKVKESGVANENKM